MSSAQIEAVGRRIRGELDPIKRRIAFARLLEGLTLENAAEIRAQIAHLPGSSSEFRDFHYAWGAIAGAEAVMHGAETREPDMHAALAGWAGSDPSAALAWFESLDAKGKGYENQAYLARGMIDGLANVDIGAATDLVFSLAAAGNEQAQGLMGLVRSKLLQSTDPASAAQWAADLPQGALRTASMDHMARAFLHSDQAAAAAWAENFAGDPAGPRVVRAVAEEWVRRDPPASIEWLASLPEMDGKNAAMGAAYGQWAKNDVTAASEYLVELQPSGARDAAISSFTRQLSVTNPEDAIIWAAEINDLGTRQGALVHIGRAMLGSDPEGARLWLSTSGLSAEQQQQVFSK